MKWFALGVLATLIAIAVGAYVYLEMGFVDARADIPPSALDSRLGSAMDASTERHAPEVANPVPATDETLVAGARLYMDKCAVCHGSLVNPKSDLGEAFNPPAPQFFGDDPPEMPENQNFYIIKHGIRMTAMPSWSFVMSDSEIWQVVNVLTKVKSLPAEVEEELHRPTAVPSSGH